MRRVGDLMVERKEDIARAMTREMGKVLAETRGDVQEGIDTAYYAAGEGRRLFGHTVPSELQGQVGDDACGGRSAWRASSPRSTSRWRSRPGRSSRRCCAGTRWCSSPPTTCPHTGTLLVEVLLEAGAAARSDPAGARPRLGRGQRAGRAPEGADPLVHRLDRDGREARRGVRPDAQAAVARDGRQERDDRDGRRGPRRSRWTACCGGRSAPPGSAAPRPAG